MSESKYKIETKIEIHNPENVPASALLFGHRFLCEDEIHKEYPRNHVFWFANDRRTHGKWTSEIALNPDNCSHEFPCRAFTYSTPYTREELASVAKNRKPSSVGPFTDGPANVVSEKPGVRGKKKAEVKIEIKIHNPENVPSSVLPEGFRFLGEHELGSYPKGVVYCFNRSTDLTGWQFKYLSHGYTSIRWTFCTDKTPEELEALRLAPLYAHDATALSTRPTTKNPPPILTRVHFAALAKQIRRASKTRRTTFVGEIIPVLKRSNVNFDEAVFRKACGIS